MTDGGTARLADIEEENVPDRKLVALVILVIVLSLGHGADHLIRGDLRWQLLPATIFIAIYAFLGLGLYFYLRGKAGPLFWAIAAGIGVVLGWLGHFSPFTDQTPQAIYHAYANPAAGWLAVAILSALMLSLIAMVIYAEYLWAKGSK
jgi:hypothetical protein